MILKDSLLVFLSLKFNCWFYHLISIYVFFSMNNEFIVFFFKLYLNECIFHLNTNTFVLECQKMHTTNLENFYVISLWRSVIILHYYENIHECTERYYKKILT